MGIFISSTEQFHLPKICGFSFTAQVVIFYLKGYNQSIFNVLGGVYWLFGENFLMLRPNPVLYVFYLVITAFNPWAFYTPFNTGHELNGTPFESSLAWIGTSSATAGPDPAAMLAYGEVINVRRLLRFRVWSWYSLNPSLSLIRSS